MIVPHGAGRAGRLGHLFTDPEACDVEQSGSDFKVEARMSAAPQPLFRPEAVHAQADHFLGPIRIARPASFRWVTAVAGALLLGLLAFSLFGEVTRKARIPGFLVPTWPTVALASPMAGLLTAQRVAEGETVRAGQVLFVLDVDRAGARGAAAALVEASLVQRLASLEAERSSRRQQAQDRQQALAERLRALEIETQRSADELALARRRVDLAQRSQDRLASLAKEGFVSDAAAQQKQEEWLEALSRAEAAERTHSAQRREAQATQAELQATATQWATDSAQLERQRAALSQEITENGARREVVVKAPHDCVISAIHLPVGGLVLAGQAIATLLPGGAPKHSDKLLASEAGDPPNPLVAHLYAPSRTAGFIAQGQTVRIRYAAYPHQKFGMGHGTVMSVSPSPVAPQDLPAGMQAALSAAAQTNEPMFRVTVSLTRQSVQVYGSAKLLKPGLLLQADVLQARLKVWEWWLDPVLAVWGRVR